MSNKEKISSLINKCIAAYSTDNKNFENKKIAGIDPKELVEFCFRNVDGPMSFKILEMTSAHWRDMSFNDWQSVLSNFAEDDLPLKALLQFLYIFLEIHSVKMYNDLDVGAAHKERVLKFYDKSNHAFFAMGDRFRKTIPFYFKEITEKLIAQGAPPAIRIEPVHYKID
jgi:hypothetical protein